MAPLITVTVSINGTPILLRSATNVTKPGVPDSEDHIYKVDDGRIIRHRRDKGAAKLAIEMLKGIKEV